MNKQVVAKRYASALFEIAKEQQLLDQLEQELRVVKQVFAQNEALLSVLNHPKVALAKKKALIQEAFASVSNVLQHTFMLLLDRHRIDIVEDLVDAFITLANEARGVAEAIVYSARPLTEDETKALAEVFAKKVGVDTLRITNIIDKDVIGGVKVRIGNRIFDGSVSGKLARLQRQLTR
ncbi:MULTISPECIES: F0F1 ATP synthase subunit delta [Anoxybacillus]|jgi:F-type H+-transporting ATPase subunit delta|uniref:ATP synthase subunit delta n=3 Tax=Anoxybacillus TaxID=150247 RepID=A0A1I0SIF2_9BACL|nr:MULTISPECIES: F0F1 ATP synthase subunit delta [Anoxybacillus]EPZ38293.1 F0F1 ATP synthase subunit delta [Anoxybacillus ayderensis]KIP20428.1 F-type ATPase subunit delta [Anoxybacillus ayderensis]MBW7650436.1 F0F1 ATP synthase subunit delta [Anoxybacillus sp. ST4]OOE03266.1 F0F1 ATP synthase subunit delta [Anoxybacillus kestanbolensis]SFA39269.1 ATP synthase F1 subcomplex delta subunit [Anoxybacillus pushchinoensis]